MLILLYIFAMKLTTVAATNAGFDPLLAVWLPNLLFAGVGVGIYRRAPK
jgi:lipopolysaccharide export system permease protein